MTINNIRRVSDKSKGERMDRLCITCFAAAFLCGAVPAFAAEHTATTATECGRRCRDRPDIVITGERLPIWREGKTSTATKTNTDIKNIPQALTIVSGAPDRRPATALDWRPAHFVPGASYSSGEGNRDTLVLRGNSSTADFFVDGVRDDVQYFRDFYNVDRVEVLKGPNAMIFGRGGGGGILNRVLKRPSFNVVSRRYGRPATAGARCRFTGDFDQPLSNVFGLRLNALYENSDSFRHHVDLKRYGINPTRRCWPGQTPASTSATNISVTGALPTAAFLPTATNLFAATPALSSATPTKASPRPTSMSRRWGSSIASPKD